MDRSDINTIYSDYYNDLKVNDLIQNSHFIGNLLLEYLSDNVKYIYIDNYDDYYYYLYHLLLQKIFSNFPNIKIVTPIIDNNIKQLYVINKDTTFIYNNNGIIPVDTEIFNGEIFDCVFHFCKYYDNYGYYELINNIDLSNYTAVKVIGLCIFEPVYKILDYIEYPKLDSYIYPDGCVDL